MSDLPKREVPADELRRVFNSLRLDERVASQGYTVVIRDSKHPLKSRAAEPYCTRSEAILYLDPQGNKVAIAHRYLRRDGSLGASGLPDPKCVWHRGERLWTR